MAGGCSVPELCPWGWWMELQRSPRVVDSLPRRNVSSPKIKSQSFGREIVSHVWICGPCAFVYMWNGPCGSKSVWESQHMCEEVAGMLRAFGRGYEVAVRPAGSQGKGSCLGCITVTQEGKNSSSFGFLSQWHESGSGHWVLYLVCWLCEVWTLSLLIALNEPITSASLCLPDCLLYLSGFLLVLFFFFFTVSVCIFSFSHSFFFLCANSVFLSRLPSLFLFSSCSRLQALSPPTLRFSCSLFPLSVTHSLPFSSPLFYFTHRVLPTK